MSGTIEGKVTQVDPEGDLITDIESAHWSQAPLANTTRVIVDDEHETFGIFPIDHQQPAMTLIAIGDSDHPLRLHLVGDSAGMMLGVRAGASVKIIW